MNTPRLSELALGYARRGWLVFPVAPGGKRPAGALVPHGLKEATTDRDTIRSWWKAEPRANIGIRTGVAFDVLDIDGPAALTALDQAMPAAERPDDDPYLIGPTVRTPRGWHLYVTPGGRGNTVNWAGWPVSTGEAPLAMSSPLARSGTTAHHGPGICLVSV